MKELTGLPTLDVQKYLTEIFYTTLGSRRQLFHSVNDSIIDNIFTSHDMSRYTDCLSSLNVALDSSSYPQHA